MKAVTDSAQPSETVAVRQIRRAQEAASALLGVQGALPFDAVAAHSNFNHLFRCRYAGVDYYLKVSMDSPKAMPGLLPKERIVGEARAMRFYAECAEGLIEVPKVVGTDAQTCCLLMTDVGDGRCNLADVVRDDYGLYVSSIGAVAHTVGRCHGSSRNPDECEDLRYVDELRKFAYRALIRNGIEALAGGRAEDVLRRMEDARDCLIHSDLWAKNMLVGDDGRMALLDFEGAMRGDPAFDLATMLAAATIPAFQFDVDLDQCEAAYSRILESYIEGVGDTEWVGATIARTGPTLAVMLAARVAGPFPYSMPVLAKEILAELAVSLIDHPAPDPEQLIKKVIASAQRARIH